MPKKVRVVVVLLVVIATGAGFWFYRQKERPVNTDILTLYGNVDIREVQPAFNASGHVTRVLVQEGDHVKKGQLLATLDDTRYAAALNEAQAAMDAARVNYQNDRVIYRRYTNLATTNATAIQQRDNAKASYEAAHATYRAKQAAVSLAQQQLDDTQLYAPADGTVENRIMEPGDMASPATPVFTIALPSPLWVRTYVPESDLGRVKPGMAATVTTDSYPDQRYQGWIGYISPTAEFTPKTVETPELRTALVYQMRVYVCDPQGQLRLGMPATVDLDLTQPAQDHQTSCQPDHAPAQ